MIVPTALLVLVIVAVLLLVLTVAYKYYYDRQTRGGWRLGNDKYVQIEDVPVYNDAPTTAASVGRIGSKSTWPLRQELIQEQTGRVHGDGAHRDIELSHVNRLPSHAPTTVIPTAGAGRGRERGSGRGNGSTGFQ